MSDLILAGGTVVTADGSFRADVAVARRDDRGDRQPISRATAPRCVDVSGALVMPGFIDGHTHMDMPFGGTVTADDWDTGTAAALAGGTTTIVDFSLQDVEGTLAGAVETWQGKAEGKAHIDYGLHVAITNLTDAVKDEIRTLPELGVATVKIFMAYKGTPLFTRGRGPVRGAPDRARDGRARARPRRERRRDRQAPGSRRSRAATPRRASTR